MKYKFVPISNLSYPRDGMFNVYVDYWWIVTDDNEIIFFQEKSPQCNKDKRICDMLMNTVYKDTTHKVVQIPVIYIETNPNDY